jgi:hypothetical protein
LPSLIAIMVAVSSAGYAASAHDPSTEREAWFKSLRQPGSQIPCCDISDCSRTKASWRDGQWWAVVRGRWMPVPRDRELTTQSIDGDAYVCASQAVDRMIFCFVPPQLPM